MTPYIDMHCDTLMQAWLHRKKDVFSLPKAMVDVERLQKGECMAQFFAIFMPPIKMKKYMGPFFPKNDAYIEKLCNIFENTINCHSEIMAFAGNAAELKQNYENHKISAFLTLEDGRAIDGSMEKLERFYKMGVRLISLTWNQPNCFGFPNSDDAAAMGLGLTDFGKLAVERMNELGILIDVSHLSDGGFADVLNISKKPFVASHSNCRALSPHRRNLTDEMLKALAEKGGVAGVNFGPGFLSADITSTESTLPNILAQLRHMIQIGGIGCAAIGTDFDGIKGNLAIPGADKMPLLFYKLEQEGFTAEEIEHIAYKNVQRVLADAL
ncbi:MAG: dipeptidase [Oscillospiraceae bacterium]